MNWDYAEKRCRCFSCGKPVNQGQLIIPFEGNAYCSDGCYSVRIPRQTIVDGSMQSGYRYKRANEKTERRLSLGKVRPRPTLILETPLPAFTRYNANEYQKY